MKTRHSLLLALLSILLVVVVVGLVLVVSSNKAKEKAVSAEKDRLQGMWTGERVEENGHTVAQRLSRLAFDGDQWVMPDHPDEVIQGTYTVDPTREPKTIDFFQTAGLFKGKTRLGIYALEGDRLTICFARVSEKERPKEFRASAGQLLDVYRRIER